MPIDDYDGGNCVFLRSLTPKSVRFSPIKKAGDDVFYSDDACKAVFLAPKEEQKFLAEIERAFDFCGRVIDNLLNKSDVPKLFEKVRILDVIVKRGEFDEHNNLISTSGISPKIVGEVAAHEVGHAVEHLVPRVRRKALDAYIRMTTDPEGQTRAELRSMITDAPAQSTAVKEYCRLGNIDVSKPMR